ncbi:MAG: hypothetical protein KDA85_20715, partial [Planctomycetaceae bacterium]|nr:hypothetical protein [Planctomycetaceae bacterium]
SDTEQRFARAAASWRSGELQQAGQQLDQLIAESSLDPRVFFLRGIVTEQSGENGDSFFKQGADLEVDQQNSRFVNQFVSRIQGAVREKIERHRAEASADMTTDPVRARQTLMYRDAMQSMQRGDREQAISLLDRILANDGADPRPWYMKGVALAESGEMETAQEMFRKGLSLEVTAEDVRHVNLALNRVQGHIRRVIEEETTIASGTETLTRGQVAKAAFAREKELQEELIAADVERTQELLAAAAQAAEMRAAAAANAFRRQQDQQSQAAARIEAIAAVTPPPMPTPVEEPMPTTPAPSAPNPFSTAPNPFAQSPAAGAAQSTPVEYSWLPANPDTILVVRMAEMSNSAFVKSITQNPAAGALMAQQKGLDPRKIDWIAAGFEDLGPALSRLQKEIQAAGNDRQAAQAAQRRFQNELATQLPFSAAIRTVEDITLEELTAEMNVTESTHAGKTIYALIPKDGDGQEAPFYMTMLDARNVVLGSEPGLKSALDRGPTSQLPTTFSTFPTDSQFILAMSSPELQALSAEIPDLPPSADTPAYVRDLISAVRGKITGGALTISLENDLTLSQMLILADAGDASTVTSALQTALDDAKAQLTPMQAMAPGPLQPTVQEFIDSLQSSSSGNQVSVQLKIPGSLPRTLAENPAVLFQLMGLMGGMGPGGPGGGFP